MQLFVWADDEEFSKDGRQAHDEESGGRGSWHEGDLAGFGAETPSNVGSRIPGLLNVRHSATVSASGELSRALCVSVVQKHTEEKRHFSHG